VHQPTQHTNPKVTALVPRHGVAVRVTHWINALCLFFLVASGLQIFNAHPRLYLGKTGADHDHAVMEIASERKGDLIRGSLRVGSLSVDTTGFLGANKENGAIIARAFPAWLTLPSYHDLGAGRRWHFAFAWLLAINGLLYLGHGFWTRHLRRDLLPTRDQLVPRHVWHEIKEHARLRFAKGEEARRYNVLQKVTYLLVAVVLLPTMVATGLAMSPGMDAAFPLLPELFGGRQTARTLHFITASSLVVFVAVHLAMVVASGLWNNLRSMVTGRYAIDIDGGTQ
jgi:thiosulfate reductase cytochrome b subunit